MNNKFRSRKFLITIVALLSACAGLLTGKLASADFATVASACVVAYSFANAATYFKPAHNAG